ncbi:MAG: MATE family efflux transporter [Clostridia bacterium]|nr:MATE family efflux transporter [Clostridia bacterium]MBO7170993.1 MATE family efflux transporter [Clostridia bacterium]
MASGTISKDFTRGNIAKQLLLLSLPFMASNALQVLYSTIDMVIVGKFVGTAGLSAVSQSSQIMNFAMMICLGFSNAGQVLISQALGAGKKKELNSIIGTLFSFVTLVSLVLSAVTLLIRTPILQVMNIPVESYDMAMDYLVICTAGLFFTAGYNMVSAVLRGMGDAKRPFLFIGIASATNLVLDILFTGIWGWGVAGAAWATIIGQAVSFLFSLFYLYRRKEAFGFDFKLKSLRLDKKYTKMTAALGAPMAVQFGFINLSMLFVNSLINSVGVVASATFGVGVRIDDIVNKISQGIQYAALPMISQNIGAGNTRRAKKVVYNAWLISVFFTAVSIAMYVFFGEELFRIFDDNPAVHEMSATFIKAILWMFPALAVMRGTGAFIQGIGNAKMTMVLALFDGVILRVGLSWLLGIYFGYGFFGFVLGYGLAAYGFAIPSLIYFLSGVWKKRRTLADDM